MYAIILLLAQRSTSDWLYPSHLEAEISQDSIEYIAYVENDLLCVHHSHHVVHEGAFSP